MAIFIHTMMFLAQRNKYGKIDYSASGSQVLKKIKTLIIQTDTLKYESSTLGISQFQDSAKHLADELKRLARMSDIHGQSFTAFSTELAHYQNMLALTEQFINQPTWQLENLSSTQYS